MNELALKYGGNPNQKPAGIFMADDQKFAARTFNLNA